MPKVLLKLQRPGFSMKFKDGDICDKAPPYRLEGFVERLIEKVPKVKGWGINVSHTIHKEVLNKGPKARKTADMLHGKWLGHPLHPVFTDIAIGAWVLGAVFDGAAKVTDSKQYKQTGNRLTEIGTVAAIPTAATGLADFSAIPKPAAKTGTLHGLLNAAALGLNIASVIQRRRGREGRKLSLAALGLTHASALLGGMMVYKHKVGTDHSTKPKSLSEWKAVLDASELPANSSKKITVKGKGVLLFHGDDRVFAIGSVCSHAAGPLENGEINDECVTCPWHDSVFNLRNGSIVHGPATQPQPNYRARINNEKVEVRLPQH